MYFSQSWHFSWLPEVWNLIKRYLAISIEIRFFTLSWQSCKLETLWTFLSRIKSQLFILGCKDISFWKYAASIYLFEFNNGYTKTIYKVCSKLTIEISEGRQWRGSGVFIVNFEQIFRIGLAIPLLTLNK